MASFPVTNGVTTFIPPPPGVIPNFDHPQQQKWLEHYLVFAIGGPLAFLALCQRYYTKIYLSKGLQIDDFFMFLGWSMSIVTQALLVRSIAEGGMCAHAWEMPLDRFERYSVITYIAAPVYQLCNGFTKLSLLAIYLQLSPQKWFKIATWSSIVIVTIYTIVISGIMFFHCNPVRKAFDFQIAHGSCLDAGTLYMATAVSNIITDVILFLLPTPLVLRLEMDRAQKIGAIVIFGIGSMTVATSIIRLTELPATLKSTDPSWDAAPADVWTFVEGNLFVICGSMPTIRRFARHMLPSVFAPPTAPSTAGSGNVNNTISQNSSRPKRCRQYELFTEDNEMHEFEARDVEEASHKDNVSNSETTVAWGGDADTNSEKAILESRDLATKHYD